MKRKWSANAEPHRKLKVPATQTKDASPWDVAAQRGADVKALQKAINKRLSARKIPGRLIVDGVCGRQTIAKGRLAARSLGIGLKGDGITVYAQRLIIDPTKRTADQKARGKKWVAEHTPPPKPKVRSGTNTVTSPKGASDRDKLVAALLAATDLYYSGKSHRFYSQAGSWTVKYGITGEPQGYRSDCSQFATSMFWSAGLEDPNRENYTGGYTGTLGPRGTIIRREDLQPGDLILYGTGTYHHVEVYIGDGVHKWSEAPVALRDRTVGHGSPPVDFGDIDMIAGAVPIRPFGLAA